MSLESPRLVWSVGGLLWGVSYVALALGGLVSPANRSGVIGLTLLGHGLVLLAIADDIVTSKWVRAPDDAGLITGVLAIFLVLELAAFLVAQREHESDQSLWFANALVFAIAGILACWRGGASDGAIAVQILFQGLMIIPGLGAALLSGVSLLGTPETAGAMARAGPFASRFFVIVAVILPVAFVAILAALANDHARAVERPSRIWTALLIHEASYVLLAARWCYDGF